MKRRIILLYIFFLVSIFSGLFLTAIQSVRADSIIKLDLGLESSAYPISLVYNYTYGEGSANRVSISADGMYIAVSSGENITLYNRTSHTPMWNYTATGTVQELAISGNGQFIIAGTTDQKALLFNHSYSINKKTLWTFNLGDLIRSVAISADGIFVAIGDRGDNTYCLNNTYSTSKTAMWTYTTGNMIRKVVISADGTYIVCSSNDQCLYLLNNTYSENKLEMWNYSTEGYGINDVSISADGSKMVATFGNNISLFNNLYSQNKAPSWIYNDGVVKTTVRISADGNTVLSEGDQPASCFNIWYDLGGVPDLVYAYSFYSKEELSLNGCYILCTINESITDNLTLYDTSNSAVYWSYNYGLNISSISISEFANYFVAGFTGFFLLYYHDIIELSNGGGGDGTEDAPFDPIGLIIIGVIVGGGVIGIAIYTKLNPEKFKKVVRKLKK